MKTNPNKVKQDIQRDLQNRAAGAQVTNQVGSASALSQFKTNPQQVRNDIQQDLNAQANVGLNAGTNAQEVRNEIQRDLQA
ncbi:MAG: hypothetical protein K6T26_02310 [Alicyclobacillus sp.]|nr:hypothetical protein [Alicyclobacillus sp.]